MSLLKNIEKFITAWDDGGVGYFKIGRIWLTETGSAKNLEAAAKKAARDISAEVMYAWELGKDRSDAWWLGWGGYDLEEEIPFAAAMAKEEVQNKINTFNPDDNEFECASIEEYKEMLFNAYDEDLTAADLKRGFSDWLQELSPDAQRTLLSDLVSWQENARKG
ncbi:hypothetical protein [Sneathiella sp.]|uniref:hypothetical protein n=1 Tax=Sneathiella sp. TaxID=1964365 RepID=UPI003566ACFF